MRKPTHDLATGPHPVRASRQRPVRGRGTRRRWCCHRRRSRRWRPRRHGADTPRPRAAVARTHRHRAHGPVFADRFASATASTAELPAGSRATARARSQNQMCISRRDSLRLQLPRPQRKNRDRDEPLYGRAGPAKPAPSLNVRGPRPAMNSSRPPLERVVRSSASHGIRWPGCSARRLLGRRTNATKLDCA
jgi:hypothetical protein